MKNIRYAFSALALLFATNGRSLAQSTYEPYIFTTIAGGSGFNSPDKPGSALRFNIHTGIAIDSAGNFLVTDTFNYAIRKVTPTGEITTLAGLPGVPGSADGTGGDARFFYPFAIALDSAGNAYVVGDSHTVRKVTPDGVVTTIAGLADNPGSTDGIGSAARFNSPSGAAVDRAGNVYVAEYGNHTIRKLTPVGSNWVVTTIAGLAGSRGSADGTNRAARFNFPQNVALDGAGNLYVDDTDNFTIRKVTPVGTNWVVTTLAGRAGSFGNVDGTNSDARFNGSCCLAVDAGTNIYVADTDNHVIRKVTPVGTNWVVTTLAGLAGNSGSADGIGTGARFNEPYGVTVDSAGNLYVADTFNYVIRKMTLIGTNWAVTTLAGIGRNFGSTNRPGNGALFKGPSGVAVDGAGNTYVADQINHTIRKVTSAGEVTTIAGLAGYSGSANGANGAARFNDPSSVAVDASGNVYVADTLNHTIRKLAPVGSAWSVTTLAGFPNPLGNGGSTDGTGSAARFAFPGGVAVDGVGNLYVADTFNSTIRKVTPAGVVTTPAGTAGQNGSTDGTGATARFNMPRGIAVDNATNIYLADTENHTIRKVTPARVVTTLVGQPGAPGSADGIGNAARFYFPSSIAVDFMDNLYVADAYNNTIRKLTLVGTNWVVTTLGGIAGFYGTADGVGSAARFSNPGGIAVDSAGNLYVADFYFNAIRKGNPVPRLLNPGFTAGRFRFNVTGPAGPILLPVVVEASTDLFSWQPISTNTSLDLGDIPFRDAQSSAFSNRFYRARVATETPQ